MTKLKSTALILPILIAFCATYLLPFKNLRVERLISRVSSDNSVLIIGNSVLGHVPACDDSGRLPKWPDGVISVSEGGLLLEELYLASSSLLNKGITEIIIVATPYQFFQPLYYPKPVHRYYTKQFGGVLLSNAPFKQESLWRLDDVIAIGSERVGRRDASGRVKSITAQSRCDLGRKMPVELTSAIYRHTSNLFGDSNVSVSMLAEMDKHVKVKVLIVPVYLGVENSDPELLRLSNEASARILREIQDLNIDVTVLNVSGDIKNYDEPWCMCGHLSVAGKNKMYEMLDHLLQTASKSS